MAPKSLMIIGNMVKAKPMCYLQYMPKQRGGRHYNLTTFKTLCSPEGAHGKLMAMKSLKMPDDADDYVHVLQSKMKDTELVVKVQEKGKMLSRELEVQERLAGQPNIVQFVCSFECNFDRIVWNKPVDVPRTFCDNTGDPLTLIIMEYINSDLSEFLETGGYSKDVLASILKQAGLCLFNNNVNFGISHNDLNRGNLLLDIGEPKEITYTYGAKETKVNTHGYEFILVDFQRSSFLGANRAKERFEYAVDEISLLYDVVSRWIKDTEIKASVKMLMEQVMAAKSKAALFKMLSNAESYLTCCA